MIILVYIYKLIYKSIYFYEIPIPNEQSKFFQIELNIFLEASTASFAV